MKKERSFKMSRKLKPVLSLFSGIQLFLNLLFVTICTTTYLYIVTRNAVVSITVGVITMFFIFYSLVYSPKKIKRELYLLTELQKYATNVTFYLKSGYNVLKALENSKEKLDPKIQKDIEITINSLRDKAELDTKHFHKYNSYAIDIFHKILKIKYEKGGNTDEMFSKVISNINFELVKRDELYRRKKAIKKQVLFMMTMVLCMPLIMVLIAKNIYSAFLSIGTISIGVTVGLFISILINLYFLERACTDISLRF